MPPTILVNVLSILLGLPLGIALGIFAALKKNTWIDHVVSVIIVVFISVPSFVLAFFLQYFLSFKLGWFPLVMASKAEAGGLFTWKMVYSLMLPIMASAFYEIAYFARTVRAELTEALTSDYMLLARTKGLTQSKAVIHHALKNAMVPILPVVIGTFLSVMGGSMVLERIFAIPGVGDLTLKSLAGPDYDLFVGTAMFYTLIGLLAGILTDLSYGFLDPRIKMGER
ncbi:MAG: ABC transporter permease [Clostridia bacterium]|nr:ABC transporter permease [Clostridia bacterium]